jgi:hypothetical protein
MKTLNPRYLLDSKLFAEHELVFLGGPHVESVENRLILQVSSYPTDHLSAISSLSGT